MHIEVVVLLFQLTIVTNAKFNGSSIFTQIETHPHHSQKFTSFKDFKEVEIMINWAL